MLEPKLPSSYNRYFQYSFSHMEVAIYMDKPVVRKTTGTSGTSGTVSYFHRNQQYSIVALTDSSGNVSERYAYTAYRQPTFLYRSGSQISNSAISNRYTYTAREWDATLGMHHFRTRWMSGLTGRFLTRDPIGFDGSEWGLYEYGRSSPIDFIDPNGECAIDDCCCCAEDLIVKNVKTIDSETHWGTPLIPRILQKG